MSSGATASYAWILALASFFLSLLLIEESRCFEVTIHGDFESSRLLMLAMTSLAVCIPKVFESAIHQNISLLVFASKEERKECEQLLSAKGIPLDQIEWNHGIRTDSMWS